MTPRSLREKWMLALLPAILILLIGWSFFLDPAAHQVEVLRAKVEKMGALSTRQAQVAQVKVECAALQKSLAARRDAQSRQNFRFDRNRALQQVSKLCALQGLSLNATSADTTSARLPPSLQDAAQATNTDEGATPPQFWRLELNGSYDAVVGLLDGLQDTAPLIVPLSLSMETGKTERQPAKWVLTLWL